MYIAPKSLNSADRRKHKKAALEARYKELKHLGSVERVHLINEEFGPYWFYTLRDLPIPFDLLNSERYREWNKQRSNKK